MERLNNIPVKFFAGPPEWEKWLEVNHDQPTGVWIKFAKKTSGITSLNYDQALDVALCYGWIDGQMKSLDEIYYLQKFTPRRPKSTWSKRNISKIAELSTAGKMRPSGIAAVEAAKADGRWDLAYDSPSNMRVPADFKAALDHTPDAKKFYNTLNKANTYAILWRIQTAKTPQVRQARIEKIIGMLAEGKQFHP